MLKTQYLVKFEEQQATDALRRLLEKVSILQIENISAPPISQDWVPDLIAQLRVHRRKHLLVCCYKSNGQPRYARSALLELRNYTSQHASAATLVFIAPYISPAVRQMCEELGAGYLDLQGNARIVFDSVFIERIVENKPVAEQRELKSLFRPKSAQVLRTMLSQPNRAWRVTELAQVSGVSLGHVSNVRSGLIDREWACASDDGLILSEPDRLLDTWRDAYATPPGVRMPFYTPLHGSTFDDAARGAMSSEAGAGHATFASFSAAQWLAPYGRTGMHYFFADEDGLHKLKIALKLAPSSKGENVVIHIPKDTALLTDTIEPVPGAICTSAIQTYLDLSIAGERGSEAADHLRQEKLLWRN